MDQLTNELIHELVGGLVCGWSVCSPQIWIHGTELEDLCWRVSQQTYDY